MFHCGMTRYLGDLATTGRGKRGKSIAEPGEGVAVLQTLRRTCSMNVAGRFEDGFGRDGGVGLTLGCGGDGA